MARTNTTAQKKKNNGANVGYEAELWQMADTLRGSMDAAEYKHVVLGLIFLKYISDAFEEQHAKLEADRAQGADPEDPDEYCALNIFWVPPEARWSHLKTLAKQPMIGQLVDDAMAGIERNNPSLKGVLPKDYARPGLDKQRLGQLIDMVSNIRVGDADSRSKDVLGRVYEYFLMQFANAEGRKGGEFYTPRCVVRLLVEMIEPFKGRVYDPCCGSSGMFVQSEEFVTAHGGKIGDISIYGQESNYTTWRLARMNLAIRGIEGQIAHGNSFHNDRFPDVKADYILANPPFNVSDWGGDLLRQDKRWQYGIPPTGNANFAWVQHIIHHLAPMGLAGFVLVNGSMSTNQSGEGEIRRNIVKADLVDCMVALPGQLFYSTPIPVCLWFLARDKKNRFRDRRGQILFIDARKLGLMIDRVHRELDERDIRKLADTYHAWRGDKGCKYQYRDVDAFCYSITSADIESAGFDLNPGRYVGITDADITKDALNDRLAETAGDTLELSSSVVAQCNAVFAAVSQLSLVLQEFMDRVSTVGYHGKLKDLASVSRKMLDPGESPEQVFDLYSIPAFDTTGLPERVLGKTILSAKLSLSSDAILVSKLNPRKHRVWAVRPTSAESICSTEFVVLQPKDGRFFEYLYLFCMSQAFQNHLIAHATGSTGSRQRVNVSDLLSAPAVIPSPKDATHLAEVVRPLRLRLQSMPLELSTLNRLVSSVSDFTITRFGVAVR